MIKFNPELLRVEYAALSHITTALKGSMRLVESDENGDDVETRVKIPFAVARNWKETYAISKYLVPIPVAVVYYGDMVVMVEKGPALPEHIRKDRALSTSLLGDKPFTADVEESVNHIKKLTQTGNWCTDGFSIYEMPNDLESDFKTRGVPLTADHTLRALDVDIIRFSELRMMSSVQNPSPHTMICVANQDGKVFATPPIFKNIAEMRQSDLGIKKPKKGESVPVDQMYRLDLIDKNFDVNLEFALSAGNTVGNNFGYKAVSPLHLEKLMLALTTVNLPNIKKSVRATFPIGLTFLQAYAWLTGLASTTTDLQKLIDMRALLKMLCTKGIFKKNVIERVYRKDENGVVDFAKPEMVSLEELKTKAANQNDATRRRIYDQVFRKDKKSSDSTEATGINVAD